MTEHFLNLVRDALSEVPEDYYSSCLRSESAINLVLPNPTAAQRDLVESLRKYPERVFCYELYHQMRILLDQRHECFPGVRLQCELKKYHITDALRDEFGVGALDKEFIPNFLLHSPGDFDRQVAVMEVKCDPRLSTQAFIEDLSKIEQFITQYRYDIGVALTVNTDPERVQGIVGHPEFQNWIAANSATSKKILWIWKNDARTKARMSRLQELAAGGSLI